MPTRILHVSRLSRGRRRRPWTPSGRSPPPSSGSTPSSRPRAATSPTAAPPSSMNWLRSSLRKLRPPSARGTGQPRHPLHPFPRASRAPTRSSSATGRPPSPSIAASGSWLVGMNSFRPWRNQTGGVRDDTACARRRGAAHGWTRAAARRRAAPSSDRRPVAIAQAARRAPEPRPRLARRRGRGADRRWAHPPGTVAERREFEIATGGERAVTARDRAGARPAAPEPARRGSRPPRLRVRRDAPSRNTRTPGATEAGRSPPSASSPAGASRCGWDPVVSRRKPRAALLS